MASIIKGVDIHREFPSGDTVVQVLKGINVEMEENALTILKGRSGSGKTTLMNILGTLDKPTSGSIYINDKEITQISQNHCDALRRRYISFVFQSVALVGTMTAYENIEFMLRIAELPMERERILHCLELVGLENRADHMPFQLSGGEQQRIAIARAIVKDAPIIVLDEATAFSDPENEYLIQKAFEKLIQNKTVVMIAHRLSTIRNADQILVMEKGCLIESGTHDELLKKDGKYAQMWSSYTESINWKIGTGKAV